MTIPAVLTNALASIQANTAVPMTEVTVTARGGASATVGALVLKTSDGDDATGLKARTRLQVSLMSRASIVAALGRDLQAFDSVSFGGETYSIESVECGHVSTRCTAISAEHIDRTGRALR